MSEQRNYFELFDIPVQFKPDRALLQRIYRKLSRQYHPDYFAQSSESEQAYALQQTALLNKAWSIFQDEDATIQYVLILNGVLEPEEKYSLSADFLMEVMDLNERVMEWEFEKTASEGEAILAEVNRLKKENYEEVASILEEAGAVSPSKEALLRVKEYYYRNNYLKRIEKQLKS